jgi:hypothetical protein
MPWAGGVFTRTNGTYTGSAVWQSDAAALVKIRADRHDTHDQDIGQGVNNCLTKDGQNTPTQNISWGSFKITNLGAGTATTDAAAFGQTITAAGWNSGTQVITLTRATGGNITVTLTGLQASLGYTPANKAGDTFTGGVNVTYAAATLAVQDDSGVAAGNGGIVDLSARNNSSTQVALGRIKGYLVNGTPGGEAGAVQVLTRISGALAVAATFNSDKSLDLVGALTIAAGKKISKFTLSTSAPGVLPDGEFYMRY